jgi:predicted glycoside hydrolase/deacetylase ChbG (UPF0249 family)
LELDSASEASVRTTSPRWVVVNADDFGLSSGVNRGIATAHEHGIVTSASLMACGPAAAEAADYARGHPALSVGLHFDLGEWAYRDSQWIPVSPTIPTDDAPAVEAALEHQLRTFRELMKRDPTHLDSHQHVHWQGPARGLLARLAEQLRVPLRGISRGIRYVGSFYGQGVDGVSLPDAITTERLVTTLEAGQARLTELGCHPGHGDGLEGMYRQEREMEVTVLCDPRVRQAIVDLGIELRSFANIGDIWPPA